MWFLKWRPNANREQMETRILPCPTVSWRTDDRFKLLRKKERAGAKGTTNSVTGHRLSLSWGFLGPPCLFRGPNVHSEEAGTPASRMQGGGGHPGAHPPRCLRLRKSGAWKPSRHSSRKREKARKKSLNRPLFQRRTEGREGGDQTQAGVCRASGGLACEGCGRTGLPWEQHYHQHQGQPWFPGAPDNPATLPKNKYPGCGAAPVLTEETHRTLLQMSLRCHRPWGTQQVRGCSRSPLLALLAFTVACSGHTTGPVRSFNGQHTIFCPQEEDTEALLYTALPEDFAPPGTEGVGTDRHLALLFRNPWCLTAQGLRKHQVPTFLRHSFLRGGLKT